eukprot:CAMPEP_0114443640 /NCGR_PEP_ID=MMETSP0103-20121206/17634_1 /TAXON_ID=37642 ORGANISM="Paraphysomonas imperforata, Strain PA2" /NCGR_SAMPLE_ID=MMETSP0103 /ASSEMBLY_ACC=CAM_ASM_000201 /LENGTH=294 /DNA_ID=CAMNT_0001615071 /DNA_START=112 /DNA_END=996 /DNA_ORIENTATION=+
MCVPVDRVVGKISAVNVFASSFSSRSDDQLLTESMMGGLLQYSMQQKAVTHLRDKPPRVSLGERPWVYDGFEGVCVKASFMFGYLSLPSWLTPSPYCITMPHDDGLGWDLLVTLSLPLLGEVVRYEGPLRIAELSGRGTSSSLSSDERQEMLSTARSIYGDEISATLLQKIMGKYLLIYDGECVICDAKSQQILSAFGVSESTFHAEMDNTVFVITPFGNVLRHSDALLALLKVLPGIHHAALYTMLNTLPRFGRDRVYAYIAANRHSLLGNGKPVDTCTVLSARPVDERDRFL